MSDKQVNTQEKSIRKLIEDLKDVDPDVRYAAAWALGIMGTQAVPAIPALVEALNDEDLEVCKEVAWALEKINKKGKS